LTRRSRRNRRFARRKGFSLAEVLVGVTVLSGALLGLAATSSVGIKQTSRAREDSQYWGDAQQVMDSILARGYTNAVSGQTTVRGRAISWDVESVTSGPKQVRVIVSRTGYQNRFATVKDTIVLYLSRATPGI
jgi:prepilin-type N-terminal cleavage/methylation domain-containing protein